MRGTQRPKGLFGSITGDADKGHHMQSSTREHSTRNKNKKDY